MSPDLFLKNALIPALALLPATQDSPAARAMVLAICLQESRLTHRRQVGGPARGYAQFEQGGGVHGVLTHPVVGPLIVAVLTTLDYDPDSLSIEFDCWTAIEHNDILACCFARLLLYTLPDPLPAADNPEGGWGQYVTAWRPGTPRPLTWPALYAQAWDIAGKK